MDTFSILLSIYVGVELLSRMVTSCLTFWGAAKLFSTVAAPFYLPPGHQERWLKAFFIPQQGGSLMARRNIGTTARGTEQVRKPKSHQGTTVAKGKWPIVPLGPQEAGRQVAWGPPKPQHWAGRCLEGSSRALSGGNDVNKRSHGFPACRESCVPKDPRNPRRQAGYWPDGPPGHQRYAGKVT